MRLTTGEVKAIVAAAREAFGSETVVRLFGSRLDDHRRGGDIDLHFEVGANIPDYRARSRFLQAVETATDGRKIDAVFSLRNSPRAGFEQIAYRDGVVL